MSDLPFQIDKIILQFPSKSLPYLNIKLYYSVPSELLCLADDLENVCNHVI